MENNTVKRLKLNSDVLKNMAASRDPVARCSCCQPHRIYTDYWATAGRPAAPTGAKMVAQLPNCQMSRYKHDCNLSERTLHRKPSLIQTDNCERIQQSEAGSPLAPSRLCQYPELAGKAGECVVEDAVPRRCRFCITLFQSIASVTARWCVRFLLFLCFWKLFKQMKEPKSLFLENVWPPSFSQSALIFLSLRVHF